MDPAFQVRCRLLHVELPGSKDGQKFFDVVHVVIRQRIALRNDCANQARRHQQSELTQTVFGLTSRQFHVSYFLTVQNWRGTASQ